MKSFRHTALTLALCGGLVVAGCSNPRLDPEQKYTFTGAAAGGAAGAVIGFGIGDPFGGALVGGLIGGVTALIYDEYWREDLDQNY